MDPEDIKNQDSLEAWLKTQPQEVSVAIAHRAAMRVAPLFWLWVKPVSGRFDFTAHVISRALLTSGVAVDWPTPEVRAAAAAAAAAIRATDPAAIRATDAAARVAIRAGRAATAAADAATDGVHATTAARAASDAATAVWEAILQDVAGLQQTELPVGLLSRPLWGEGGNPLADDWAEVRSGWSTAGSGWQFWIDWYEDALVGREPDWELLKDIALIPDDDWKVDADRVNALIAHLRSPKPDDTTDEKPDPAEALQDLRSELEQVASNSQKLDGQLARLESQIQSREHQLAELQKQYKEGQDKIAELVETADRHLTELEADLERRINAAVDAVTAARTIEEPVALWTEKEGEHSNNMKDAYRWFLWALVGIGGAIAALLLALAILPDVVAGIVAPPGCDPVGDPKSCVGFSFQGVFLSAGVLTLFTLALWFLRLKMKEYLAERHLMLDARERRAFAQTYLALLAVGDASEEAKEQRTIVYASLFRHGTDGIVKDDGGLDPSLAAVASKILSR